MTDITIGKFITDNTNLLSQIAIGLILTARWIRDSKLGKKKDAESKIEKEEASMDRKEMKYNLKQNTALTVHLLDATAKQQGRTIDDIIEDADFRLDGLLEKFTTGSGERLGNEQSRTGDREH